ncbi:AMP-binding protein [Streptomyces sp. NPDC049910]|uniref:AMP-binding protein n=1 Tax=Streptomyces sp. NPDC049910 TaxID=3155278 RepID=UPI00343F2F8F
MSDVSAAPAGDGATTAGDGRAAIPRQAAHAGRGAGGEGRLVTGTVGRLPWDAVLAAARRIAGPGGGPAVPHAPTGLHDLAVTAATDVLAVSRATTRGGGAAVMSSGGTTGRPKLTYVAHHQALDRLLREWRPLSPSDTLLNLFTPGRMWASHYYMHALAERVGCDVVPAGPFDPGEVADWLGILADVGVNALAGTPTSLADFAQGLLDSGLTLPVDKLIWMAEPWTPAKERTVRSAFPGVGFWGNYGSVETYVIATNTPACDARTLHLMPDQLLESDDAGALLTRTGDGWTVPTVRYRLGDRIAPVSCRCGRPDGLRVLGRADDAISVHCVVVRVAEILDVVRAHPGVREAQLVLDRAGGTAHTTDRLCVRYAGDAPAGDVRALVLRDFYHLGVLARSHPEAVTARAVPRVSRVERTGKIPPVVWREPARGPAPSPRDA